MTVWLWLIVQLSYGPMYWPIQEFEDMRKCVVERDIWRGKFAEAYPKDTESQIVCLATANDVSYRK